MERAKPELLHAGQDVLRFAGFALDLGRGALLRPNGTQIALRPKTAELLRHLVQQAGSVVTREVLLEAVWPGVYVSEDSVTQCVAEIRRALGEAGNNLLKTLPKRGYLLDVERLQKATASDDVSVIKSQPFPSLAPNQPSLVVLPFINLSGDPDQEYFVDGLVEEITTALACIHSFCVIARNSAFTYKGRMVDVREVGRELGVRYVLDGSVRKSGSRVRITGQLIDVTSNAHLWADRFEGDLIDIFGLQDQVAEAVAGAIEPNLRAAEIMRARRVELSNLDAYDLYLQALPDFYTLTSDGAARSLSRLQQAAKLAPAFARVMALSSICHTLRVRLNQAPESEIETATGMRLAREAVICGADDPIALQYAARTLLLLAYDHDAALAAVQRSLAINPNSADAHNTAGIILAHMCRPKEAIEHCERGIRLSPLDPEMPHLLIGLSMAYMVGGHYEKAIEIIQRALIMAPDLSFAHRRLIGSLWLVGQHNEAKAAAVHFMQIAPTAARVSADVTYKLIKDRDFAERVINALRMAGLPE